MAANSRKVVVFSGGSAANSLVDVFNEVIEKNNCALTYVIPISDNGGSSSELIRVFGGPGIGDVRSRLVRLIPQTHVHILNLFNHRLPPSSDLAASEFLTLLTGTSHLYHSVPTPQAMLIRSILSHLHLEILKRNRPPTSTFNFQSASIGNLFLTGARLFSGSFESAIYLLAIMGGVDESKTAVLPAIISNFSHHISAGLADGSVITGQNAISHPSEPTALNSNIDHANPLADLNDATIEDANLPGSLPTLRQPNIHFSKGSEEPLPARIQRLWYINPYGQEMRPSPNPKVLEAINFAEGLIYSIGSLYTSIVPSLILQGVGAAIARSGGPRFKILILNGSLDRETGGFSASDFIAAVARAGEESRGITFNHGEDVEKEIWARYVTHLIHLEGEGVPRVDKEELGKWGVECVRLYGRKAEGGTARYDGRALGQALGAILGRREKGEKSRRNTLEG
ncbi:hypothetical protein HO133_001269 [Letharia lupina]|uniref:Uncharacterized protein n=1 Tax=Letharia lupina TaxID=560253 RepID=A0A8H6FBW5_9LECA|nr:uncharacterized protein HO133_001269 [Letharia lupina]KAF6222183.1 hypothetical protein HO133_001269 [Letharia lupina]